MTTTSPSPTSNPAPAAASRHDWIALYVLCTGVLMIVLDVTIVNVALPSIQTDLHFSPSGLAWVVNAYLITFGGLLLLAGRIGDLISRRGIFLAGLALFSVASLACGLAASQGELIGARFVQGIGGAMTSSVVLGMIVTMFPAPRDQAKAMGVFAFVASAGGAVGLVLGGVLTQAIDWHWIFFVNVPIGALTAAAALRLLPSDRGLGLKEGADAVGAVLITAALMLAVYTIVKPAAEDGWGATATILPALATVALFAAFLVRENYAAAPLIPLRIFRSRDLSGANLIQILSTAGMFGTFFLGALYLQRVLHYDALKIGFAFLPITILMGVMSLRFSEALIMRFSPRALLVPGLTMVAAGLAWFARVPQHGDYFTDVLPALVLMGTGMGGCFPALMTVAMSGAGPQDAGLASGVVNTASQLGAALGLAVLATLAATRTSGRLAHGASHASALRSGYSLALFVAAGLVVAAIVVTVLVLKPATVTATAHAPSSSEGETASASAGA